MTSNTATELPASPKTPQWPAHNAPRVWFLTDGLAPIAIALSRHLLEHGDYVVAGILPKEFNDSRGDELRGFMGEVAQEASGEGDGEEGDEEEDVEEGDDDGEGTGGGSELRGSVKGKNGGVDGKPRTRRKRWRERFKLVGVDGR
jgi:hypothetical protein